MNSILFPPGFRRSTAARSALAFSLVEVTLAMGIMSFALVGLMGLLPVGLTTFHSATDNSTGTQIAQRLINEAQQTDFDQLATAAPTVRYFDDQGNELLPADKARAVYDANLVVATATALPGAASNQSLLTVLVQVVNNPGQRAIPTDSASHWLSAIGLTISSYAANVARNK